jgi:hypothetical protein
LYAQKKGAKKKAADLDAVAVLSQIFLGRKLAKLLSHERHSFTFSCLCKESDKESTADFDAVAVFS